MNATYGDKVTVIDIMDRGCSVTEHGLRVCIQLTTDSNVTASKDCVVNDDATLYIFTVNSRTGIYIIPCCWPRSGILIFLG